MLRDSGLTYYLQYCFLCFGFQEASNRVLWSLWKTALPGLEQTFHQFSTSPQRTLPWESFMNSWKVQELQVSSEYRWGSEHPLLSKEHFLPRQ